MFSSFGTVVENAAIGCYGMDEGIEVSVYCFESWERAPGLCRLGKNLGLVPGRAILELVVDPAPEADYCC